MRSKTRAGITILEITVVMAVLLSLTATLFVGARAWRRGSDRATCIINIRNVQTCVRSYQNVYGYKSGTLPYAEEGSQSIADHLFQKGYISPELFQSLKGDRTCPGGGMYQLPHEEVFPLQGELYTHCSLEATQGHLLPGSALW